MVSSHKYTLPPFSSPPRFVSFISALYIIGTVAEFGRIVRNILQILYSRVKSGEVPQNKFCHKMLCERDETI